MDGETYRQAATGIVEENLESFIRTMQAMTALQQAGNEAIRRHITHGGAEEAIVVMQNVQEFTNVYNTLEKCLNRSKVALERAHAIARDIERERRMIDALR